MKPTVSADFVPPQELANEMESLRHTNPKLIFPRDQVCTQGSSSLSLFPLRDFKTYVVYLGFPSRAGAE